MAAQGAPDGGLADDSAKDDAVSATGSRYVVKIKGQEGLQFYGNAAASAIDDAESQIRQKEEFDKMSLNFGADIPKGGRNAQRGNQTADHFANDLSGVSVNEVPQEELLDPYDDVDRSVHTVMRKKRKAGQKRAGSSVVDRTAAPHGAGEDRSGAGWDSRSNVSRGSAVKSETRYIVKVPSAAGGVPLAAKK